MMKNEKEVETEAEAETAQENDMPACCTSLVKYVPRAKNCLGRLKEACCMACERFLRAKVTLLYDMTVCIHSDVSASEGLCGTPETRDLCMEDTPMSCGNTMTKEGRLEIRLSDLTLGMAAVALLCSVGCSVKRLFCRRRRM